MESSQGRTRGTTRDGGTAQCVCACHEVLEHRRCPVRAPVLHASKHDPREGGIRRGVNGSVVYRPFVAKREDGDRCVLSYLLLPRAITPYTTPRCSFTCNRSSVSTHTVSISDDAHTSLKTDPCNYRGAIAHGTPLSDGDQCALHVLQGPGTGDRS